MSQHHILTKPFQVSKDVSQKPDLRDAISDTHHAVSVLIRSGEVSNHEEIKHARALTTALSYVAPQNPVASPKITFKKINFETQT